MKSFLNERINRILPFAFFGVYSLLSIVFYREKLFADAGFYFFSITNSESLLIAHSRWAAAIPQLPLLAAIRIGLPLPTLAMIFAMAYPVFYFLIFCLNRYLFRSIQASWVSVGIVAFASPTLFFWQVSELSLGLAFASLILGNFTGNRTWKPSLTIALCVLLTIFSLSFHIGTAPALIFLWLFLSIEGKVSRAQLAYGMGAVLMFVALKCAIGMDEYESGRLALNASALSWDYIQRLFLNANSGQVFVTLGVGLLIRMAILTNAKSAKFSLIIALLSIVLINTFFPAADMYFYYDNLYLLTLFVVLTAIMCGSRSDDKSADAIVCRFAKTSMLAFVIIFARILVESTEYSDRQALGAECSGRIILLSSDLIDSKTGNWSIGAETLVLSSIGGKSGIAQAESEFASIADSPKKRKIRIAPWIELSPEELNPKYYRIDLDSVIIVRR